MILDHADFGLESVGAVNWSGPSKSIYIINDSFLEADGLVLRLSHHADIGLQVAFVVESFPVFLEDSGLVDPDKLRPYAVFIHMTSIPVLVSCLLQRYKAQ